MLTSFRFLSAHQARPGPVRPVPGPRASGFPRGP